MNPRGYKPNRLLLLLAAGLAGLTGLTACKGGLDFSGEELAKRPVAIVNGDEITYAEFQRAYRENMSQWENLILDQSENMTPLKTLILDDLVEEKLLDQEARRLGIEVNGETVQESIRQELTSEGEPEVERRARLLDKAMDQWVEKYTRRLVHKKLVDREVTGRIHISEREMHGYYNDNRRMFDLPEQVRVRHIAVETKAKFDELVSKLQRGNDFAALAQAYSITPDRAQGGDLGWVQRGVMPQEFDQVIFSLNGIGAMNLVTPAKTQIGFHLFRLEERKPRQQMSFPEAQAQIRQILTDERKEKAYQEWLAALKKKAVIQINEKLLSSEIP
ncbi:MAG: peptidylprolyl isomerase [Deltaproteobacteria bacterium]|nr:peptidylprolyl isomerase [Deltaproteobacteria bacterium]